MPDFGGHFLERGGTAPKTKKKKEKKPNFNGYRHQGVTGRKVIVMRPGCSRRGKESALKAGGGGGWDGVGGGWGGWVGGGGGGGGGECVGGGGGGWVVGGIGVHYGSPAKERQPPQSPGPAKGPVGLMDPECRLPKVRS